MNKELRKERLIKTLKEVQKSGRMFHSPIRQLTSNTTEAHIILPEDMEIILEALGKEDQLEGKTPGTYYLENEWGDYIDSITVEEPKCKGCPGLHEYGHEADCPIKDEE